MESTSVKIGVYNYLIMPKTELVKIDIILKGFAAQTVKGNKY